MRLRCAYRWVCPKDTGRIRGKMPTRVPGAWAGEARGWQRRAADAGLRGGMAASRGDLAALDSGLAGDSMLGLLMQ